MTDHICSHLSRRQALFGTAGVLGAAALGSGGAALANTSDPAYPTLGDSGYRVTHYSINNTMFTGRTNIWGATTMTCVATRNLTSLQVDFQLNPNQVSINGKAVTYSAVTTTAMGNGRFTVSGFSLTAGQQFTLRVGYNTQWNLRRTSALVSPTSYYAVAGEPLAAAQWHPCNDRLDNKATYDVSITTEARNTVMLYAPTSNFVNTSNNWRTMKFVINEACATYQLGLAIGPFTVSQGSWNIAGTMVPYRVAVQGGAGLSASPVLTYTPRTLNYFASRYGAFPFSHAGGVVLGNTSVGAQETIGGPTYDSGCNTRSFVAHENAHMWFGNSVTASSWADVLFIQEGLAELLEWDYLTTLSATGEMWAPLVSAPSGSKVPRNMTVTVSAYGNAGGIQRELRRAMDGSIYQASAPRHTAFLKNLATNYRHKSITRAQFKAEAAKAAGKDLGWFWTKYAV